MRTINVMHEGVERCLLEADILNVFAAAARLRLAGNSKAKFVVEQVADLSGIDEASAARLPVVRSALKHASFSGARSSIAGSFSASQSARHGAASEQFAQELRRAPDLQPVLF